MTDARDAEAAARDALCLAIDSDDEDAVQERLPDCLDAYRDAIEARVRGERDAEVRALVEAVAEFRALPMLRGESGAVPSFTVTYKDTGVLDRLDAAHKPFEEAQP